MAGLAACEGGDDDEFKAIVDKLLEKNKIWWVVSNFGVDTFPPPRVLPLGMMRRFVFRNVVVSPQERE